jgi:hypothetical protein
MGTRARRSLAGSAALVVDVRAQVEDLILVVQVESGLVRGPFRVADGPRT